MLFPRHRACQSERPTKTYNSTPQTGSKLQCNLSTESEPTHLLAVEVGSSLWVDGGGGAAASAGAEIRTWVTESGPCCLQVWHRSCDRRKVHVTQLSSDHWLAWLVGLHRLKQRISTWEEELFCSLVTCQINVTVGVNPKHASAVSVALLYRFPQHCFHPAEWDSLYEWKHYPENCAIWESAVSRLYDPEDESAVKYKNIKFWKISYAQE